MNPGGIATAEIAGAEGIGGIAGIRPCSESARKQPAILRFAKK